jgi:hypothetical protein
MGDQEVVIAVIMPATLVLHVANLLFTGVAVPQVIALRDLAHNKNLHKRGRSQKKSGFFFNNLKFP